MRTQGRLSQERGTWIRWGPFFYKPHWPGTAKNEEMEANAAYIVLAANHHQKLVKALETYVKIFGIYAMDPDDNPALKEAAGVLDEIKEASRG